MHSDRLLDHFRNPRNAGELAPPSVKVDVTNPACGDMLRLWARFENEAAPLPSPPAPRSPNG
jgi:nitrogen fixation NifU-like protein